MDILIYEFTGEKEYSTFFPFTCWSVFTFTLESWRGNRHFKFRLELILELNKQGHIWTSGGSTRDRQQARRLSLLWSGSVDELVNFFMFFKMKENLSEPKIINKTQVRGFSPLIGQMSLGWDWECKHRKKVLKKLLSAQILRRQHTWLFVQVQALMAA